MWIPLSEWLAQKFDPAVLPPPGPHTLAGLGLPTLIRIAVGMLSAKTLREPVRNYADAVTRSVGRPLYEMFYGPFARKLWGVPGEDIAVELADPAVGAARMTRPSLSEWVPVYPIR